MHTQAMTPISPASAGPYGAHSPQGTVRWLLETTRALPTRGLMRQGGFALRRIAIALLKGRPLDVESFGARFRLYPYNNVCEKRILFQPELFDAEERALLARHIRPGFRFVDIGANIGGYALFVAAQAGDGARVLAIEPQPAIFERLVYNIGLNVGSHPTTTISALPVAVADRDGDVTLFIDRGNQGESSLKLISPDAASSVRVRARPLLSILESEGFDRVDAIKLDVEGAEDLILEAFFRTAPDALRPGLIILERAPSRWALDLPALLTDKGYGLILTTRNNFIFERRPAGGALAGPVDKDG